MASAAPPKSMKRPGAMGDWGEGERAASPIPRFWLEEWGMGEGTNFSSRFG